MAAILTICFDDKATELSLDGVPWAKVTSGHPTSVEILGPGPAEIRLPGIAYASPDAKGTTVIGLHLAVSTLLNHVERHRRAHSAATINAAASSELDYP